MAGTAEARRVQILQAVKECFGDKGFHQTTMEEICSKVQLSPGSLYRYYRGKADLIADLVEKYFLGSAAGFTNMKERIASIPSVAGLLEAHLAYFNRQAPQDLKLFVEVYAESARNPRFRAVVLGYIEKVISTLTSAIKEAQDQGKIHPQHDPELLAGTLLTFFEGLRLQKAVNPDLDLTQFCGAIRRIPAVNVREVEQGVVTPECTGCTSCVRNCPRGALQFKAFGVLPVSVLTFSVLFISVFFGSILLAKLTGHWESIVPSVAYKAIYHQYRLLGGA